MNSFLQKIVLGATLVSLLACAKKEDSAETSAVDAVEASVESGVTMLQGVADDQAGSSYSNRSEKPSSVWQQLLKPDVATAFSCGRAFSQSCSSGVKSISYTQCDLPYSSATLDGSITLTYSDSNCAMAALNSTVTRGYDLTFTGPRGGSLAITSEVNDDYRGGASYGGGGRLTRTASGFDLEILGRHSVLNFKTRNLADVSVRTLQAVAINQVARNGRTMTGGQIEVNHNLAQFTSVFTPNNLAWNNSCCHPVSGSLDVTYSGSKSGSATVTFAGTCGSATVVDQDGQSQEVRLSYCE
jgi:hypothetical protein